MSIRQASHQSMPLPPSHNTQHYGAHTDGVTSISMHPVRTSPIKNSAIFYAKLSLKATHDIKVLEMKLKNDILHLSLHFTSCLFIHFYLHSLCLPLRPTFQICFPLTPYHPPYHRHVAHSSERVLPGLHLEGLIHQDLGPQRRPPALHSASTHLTQ